MPDLIENYMDLELEDEYQIRRRSEDDSVASNLSEACDDEDYGTTFVARQQNHYVLESNNLADNNDSNETHRISYVKLITLCERYLRLINNDKLRVNFFHSTLKESIRQAEFGHNTHTTYGTIVRNVQ